MSDEMAIHLINISERTKGKTVEKCTYKQRYQFKRMGRGYSWSVKGKEYYNKKKYDPECKDRNFKKGTKKRTDKTQPLQDVIDQRNMRCRHDDNEGDESSEEEDANMISRIFYSKLSNREF